MHLGLGLGLGIGRGSGGGSSGIRLLRFMFHTAGTGGVTFTGTGTSTWVYLLSTTGIGWGPVTGTGTSTWAMAFATTGAGVTTSDVAGTGTSTFTLALASTGAGYTDVVGTGTSTYTEVLATDGTGDSTPATTGTGASTFTMVLASTGAGVETFTGTGTSSFTLALATSGQGAESYTGTGTSTFTMVLSSTGAGAESYTGTGTSSFTMVLATTAGVGSVSTNPIPGLTGLKFYVDTLLSAPHVSSAANIDSWLDQSGQGNSLNTIPSGCSAPQLQGDGSLKVVAASSQGICNPGASRIGTGHFCIGIVVKVNATVDNSIIFGDSDLATGGVNIKVATTSYSCEYYVVAGHADGTIDTSAYHVLIFDRPTSGAITFYLDGTVTTIGSGTTDPIAALAVYGGICMGTFGNYQNSNASCQIKAAFICNSDIGSTNVAAVQAYWKAQYSTP